MSRNTCVSPRIVSTLFYGTPLHGVITVSARQRTRQGNGACRASRQLRAIPSERSVATMAHPPLARTTIAVPTCSDNNEHLLLAFARIHSILSSTVLLLAWAPTCCRRAPAATFARDDHYLACGRVSQGDFCGCAFCLYPARVASSDRDLLRTRPYGLNPIFHVLLP